MKPKKLDQRQLSDNLGSTIRGRVTANGGYFGALQLAESVRRRFRAPAGGGRARDRRWTMKRLIPVRPATLARLERLAEAVSDLVEYRVGAMQVAALLIERDLRSEKKIVHHDLDHLAGTWSEAEYREFMAALREQRPIDAG